MSAALQLLGLQVRPGHPDFLDLPWHDPLATWAQTCDRIVQVQRGVSRHEVVFVAYGKAIYALKELPLELGEREYERLREAAERGLPVVEAVGLARLKPGDPENGVGSVLITRFLENSLPFRVLFAQRGLERYRERLLDAMAGLLVRLHLAGFFWGDCSLSNTLFRRDAGELMAVLVDAETAEIHETLSNGQREHDLVIMEENVSGELADVAAQMELPRTITVYETGESIRQRYDGLWSEINREVVIRPDEQFRIHERIQALNRLGFSVGEVELITSVEGNQVRMRTIVTDRDYHRRQLHSLTGVVAAERQATLMLNEIMEIKAMISGQQNRSASLSSAAFRWLNDRYLPTVDRLVSLAGPTGDVTELYCQVLEHKWYLSERAGTDVGLDPAVEDYLKQFPPQPTGVGDAPSP